VIHYRWHPLYGRSVRRIQGERRASGEFVRVELTPGAVTILPAWKLDAVYCAGLKVGVPMTARLRSAVAIIYSPAAMKAAGHGRSWRRSLTAQNSMVYRSARISDRCARAHRVRVNQDQPAPRTSALALEGLASSRRGEIGGLRSSSVGRQCLRNLLGFADVVTSFLPAVGSNIKVDFWCATASQVGYFEELNMFLASSGAYSKATGHRAPLATANLGHWWNAWDRNDIISFTTNGIFAGGIDDEEYWSGTSLAAAHGGYLR
jgi:hypothetical protein